MKTIKKSNETGGGIPKSLMTVIAIVAIPLAAVVIYLPTLRADFVYDDVAQIEIDDYIHKPDHLWEVLSLRVLSRDVLDNNRPVMLLSLILDSMIWGHNPFGYHLTNLLLHAACSILLLLLLYGIFRRLTSAGDSRTPMLGAIAGAIIFAVHPVGSEAVCAVSFREDLLVTFFVLAGLLLAERFPTERRWTTVLLGGGCAVSMLAAVACKESGAVAPAILLAYWLIFRRHGRRRAWVGLTAASFVIVAAFLAARFSLQPENSVIFTDKPTYLGGSFSTMLKIQPRIWAFQVSQVLWPNQLCADQTAYSVRHISLAFALAVLAIVALVTVLLARRNSGVGFGAACYWLALLPVSNFVPIYRPMADRYLYLPMVGVCIAAGAIVCRLKISSKRWGVGLSAAGAVICIALGVVTVRRTLVWKTERSLWEDAAIRNPQSFAAHNGLGFVFFEDGEFDEAVRSFKQAYRLSPGQPGPLAGFAITYDAMGKPDLAEQALREAIRRDSRYADPDRLVEALIWSHKDAERLRVVVKRISGR